MVYFYPIWLFFAAFFFYFGYIHWRQSTDDIRPFQFRDREPNPGSKEGESVISQGNVNFVQDFNRYLETTNKHNRSRHRAAAIGYFVSGLVALISMGMLLFVS